MKLFFLENRYNQRIAAWGDYGVMLWTGFTDKDEHEQVFIERAGPFTPDIYVTTGFLICTDRIKAGLIDAAIEGVDFLPVQKRKIVNIDWQKIPPSAEIYDVLPEINEPEELIENLEHDHVLASSMTAYWTIKPRSAVKIR